MFEWSCPACAWINKTRETRRTRTVTCNNEECRRPFGHGHILYVMPYGGIKTAPPDTVIPRAGTVDAFPTGEVDTWEHGQLLNRIVVVPEETIRQFIEAASTTPIDDQTRATDGSP